MMVRPRHPCKPMHSRARIFCKKRDPAAGLGVMLVGKGGVADEGGGDSPSSSGFLQLVRVPERERCAGAAAATCAGGRTGGTRGRLRRVGLLRLDSGQPMVREVGVGLCRAREGRGPVWGVAARGQASRWAVVWRLAGASPGTPRLSHFSTAGLPAYAVVLLPARPPALR